MKIAIDTQTTLGQKSGFGFYVKNLTESLKKVDPQNDYILIAPKSDRDFSTPQRLMWDQIYFPRLAKKQRVDILHQPCFSAPLFYAGKIVITVHDLISLHFPQNIPLVSRLYYSRWMPLTYRAADRIVAISENTKKDIVQMLHLPEEKITVIHSAVGPEFRPIDDPVKIGQIKHKYATGEKFILDVGTLEPRKNLPFLVKAFARAIKQGDLPHNLVITGKKGWHYESLFNLVKTLNLADRVIFPGYVGEGDLPILYNAAELFVFPSTYEGFGFPPLEAMACGTPVIASDNSSIPEVVDEAGILIAGYDEKLWGQKIAAVLQNQSLAVNLSRKGLSQSKKFSWEKTARETIRVYQEVLND